MSKTPLNSALWVVATPLGNLGDISPRAISILQKAGLILAEDTRRAGLLFAGLGISARKFSSLHEHNEDQRINLAVSKVEQGIDCCLVSDAGTPLMADPGYRLVRAFRQKGLPVFPVPGPCAPVAALMACGLPPYPFSFLGFLPRKKGELQSLFARWKDVPATLVFFERKNRVTSTLQSAFEQLGPREFCLAREMTKKHEEFISGVLGQTNIQGDSLLGEITIVIGPEAKDAQKTSVEKVRGLIDRHSGQGLKPRPLAALIQKETSGWSSKQIYDLLIQSES
ncbi:MAG: 16S rRNA (cytidine(1402)-2'-O)-methyltransferase [Desulfonatronovibrio sp.]